MTWYASHIYAEPTEAVVSILSSHRVLSKGIYCLKDLVGHDWPPGVIPHELPKNGLLVVREICDPTLGENRYHTEAEAQWHVNADHRVLSWKSVIGPESLPIIMPPALPIFALGSLYKDNDQQFPPVEFLRYLKNLSHITNTTICFYHHKSGAEMAVTQEFAWVFGEDESVYVTNGWDTIQKYTIASEQQSPRGKTVLMLILQYYGLNLGSFYFAPHTRRFNWHEHYIGK